MKTNTLTIAGVAVLATLGGFIGGSINIVGAIADESASSFTESSAAQTTEQTPNHTVGDEDRMPEYEADEVPDWVPTSGEDLPIWVKPEANGETSWGPSRKNPSGGLGAFTATFDGSNLNIKFTGNCGPNNVYVSSLGNAKVVEAGNVSGMWGESSLCLPSSRTDSITVPVTQWNMASCWRDTEAILTVTGTPNHDGVYRVPVSGGRGPCPGEVDQWDWANDRLKEPQPTPAP